MDYATQDRKQLIDDAVRDWLEMRAKAQWCGTRERASEPRPMATKKEQ